MSRKRADVLLKAAVLIGAVVLFYRVSTYLLIYLLYHGILFEGVIEGQGSQSVADYVALVDDMACMFIPYFLLLSAMAAYAYLALKRPKVVLKRTLWVVYIVLIVEGGTRLFLLILGVDIEPYKNYSFNKYPKIYVEEPGVLWKLRPSAKGPVWTSDYELTYETNSLGLREPEIAVIPEQYRILFLGDSQTFGEGVQLEQRFSSLVGSAIAGIETVNAGVPGYGLHQMVAWYERYGQPLKPRIVLCCLIGADLDRAVWYHLAKKAPHVEREGATVQPSEKGRNKMVRLLIRWQGDERAKAFLARNILRSHAYSYFRVKIKRLLMARHLKERDRELWRTAREPFSDASPEEADRDRIRREVSRGLLHSLKAATEAQAAHLIVVNIDVVNEEWFSQLLSTMGIDYIDLSQELRKAGNLRFEIDRHYNPAGHERIAGLLASELKKRLPEGYGATQGRQ